MVLVHVLNILSFAVLYCLPVTWSIASYTCSHSLSRFQPLTRSFLACMSGTPFCVKMPAAVMFSVLARFQKDVSATLYSYCSVTGLFNRTNSTCSEVSSLLCANSRYTYALSYGSRAIQRHTNGSV